MMIVRDKAIEALRGDTWTQGEKAVLRWQWGMLGDYWTALFLAIMRADGDNLNALADAYPDEIEAFVAWREGDLAQRFRDAGVMD